MLIDAPLGSGKTELIVQKYAELISNGKVPARFWCCGATTLPNRMRLLNRIRESFFKLTTRAAVISGLHINGVVRNSIGQQLAAF
jgi:hypothetical protein